MTARPDLTSRAGRYEIVREIGRGSMAVVHLARQPDLARDVALKELRFFDASDPSRTRRFLQESRVGAALTHPNVVTVYDYFQHDGTPYIAMEYLERGSLRSFVGRTSVAENVGALEGLLAGLDRATREHVVHRDIKPENLLVTSEGRIKIADFGIAKASSRAESGGALTRTGVPLGTPSYMAPEQIEGGEAGPWTDLYAVGVVAWELFVGHAPFHDSDTAVAIMLRHLHEDIPSAHSVKPGVDRELSAWIDRLLVKAPERRTPSASEAWDELEQIVTRLQGSCWRRAARLRDRTADARAKDEPLTPAPFAAFVAPPVAQPAPQPALGVAGPWVHPRRRAPWWRAAAMLAVATVVAAAAGLLLGGAGGSGTPVARAGTVLRNSDLAVTVDPGFKRVDVASGASRLGLAEPRAAADRGSAAVGLEAGLAEYSSPSLLSPAAVRAISGDVPRPVAVRLGGDVQAYRYDRLRLTGDRGLLTVYAVPTTNWVLTLGCFAPAAQADRLDALCGKAAATLHATSDRSVSVGPSPAFARGIGRALDRLKTAAGPAHAALGRADTPAGQARAAARLALVHERASAALLVVPGRAVDGIVAAPLIKATKSAARAYRRLATAARGGLPADYDRARRDVLTVGDDFQQARRAMARGGYQVR
jgi:hypothetical protein